MKAYFPRTPRVMMRVFSEYTWRFYSNKKEIFLTFDDGPTPEITEFVLSELRKFNAKATFFCIGKNIEKYPEIFTQIMADGHRVGNHTQNHLKGWKTKTKDYIQNTLACENIIFSKIKKFNNSKLKTQNSKLFRPPYGKIKKEQAKKLIAKGYKIVMWDVLSADFDTEISNAKCLKNVLKNTKNGSIIVFHDSKKASEKIKYTLPKVLDYFSNLGYSFQKIS